MFTATLLVLAMKQQSLASALDAIRLKYGLPSITAGVMLNGRIVELEAVGYRRAGSNDRVTVDDVYHCGSITKSFTAVLTGVLVQKHKLDWHTPLSKLFPDIEMNPAYKAVTPIHLLSHRSGLDGDTYAGITEDFKKSSLTLKEQRLRYTASALTQPPIAAPGAKFVYANRGFMVLGTALEKLTGRSWEDLMTSEVLKPLGLKSAGFGPAGISAPDLEPWGHYVENGKLVPVPPGPAADNAPVLGPAGTLHMSVPDMLRYCWFQAQEGRNGGLLTPETFAVLHTPTFGGEYMGGLIETPREWAGGQALTHAGSNTINYELIWIAPKRGFALVVAMNAVVPDVEKAADDVAALLIERTLNR